MEDTLHLNGNEYISSKRASAITGYTNDYIGQLCRAGKIKSTMIAGARFVENRSLLSYTEKIRYEREKQLEELISAEDGLSGIYGRATSFKKDAEQATEEPNSLNKFGDQIVGEKYSFKYEKEVISPRRDYLAAPYKTLRDDGPLFPDLNKHKHESAANSLKQSSATEKKSGQLKPVLSGLVVILGIVALNMTGFRPYAHATSFINRGLHSYEEGVGKISQAFGTFISNPKVLSAHSITGSMGSLASVLAFDTQAAALGISEFSVSFYDEVNEFFNLKARLKRWLTQNDNVKNIAVEKEKPEAIVQEKKPSVVIDQRPVIIEGPRTIIENIKERVVVGEGVTAELLSARLSELNNKLSSEIYKVSTNTGSAITNVYQNVALTNKIDSLEDVTIDDSTITDATISGTSTFTGSTVTASSGIFSTSLSVAGQLVTTGSFATSTLAGDFNFDSNTLYIDSVNNRIGIGTSSPKLSLHVTGTDGIVIPFGTTAQRPTARRGILRYNTTTSQFEGYSGTAWAGLGGVIDVDGNTYILAESSAGANEDTLFFNTAGSERMRISSTGNVGIGTTSPYAKLSVVGSSGVVAAKFHATSTTATSTFAGGFTAGNNAAFTVNRGSTANSLYINGAGNVGLGTAAPAAKLDVIGNIYANNQNTTGGVYFGPSGFQASVLYNSANGDLEITPRSGFDTTITAGKLGIGVSEANAVLHLKAGTASALTAPLKFTSGTLLTTPEPGAVEFLTDAYYGSITTGSARKTFAFLESPSFTTTSGAHFLITGAGNVGIGTTSPYAKLSVVGSSGVAAAKFHATSTSATSTFAGGVVAGGSGGLTVLKNGKVGVGTTSPQVMLEVEQNTTGTSNTGNLRLIGNTLRYGLSLFNRVSTYINPFSSNSASNFTGDAINSDFVGGITPYNATGGIALIGNTDDSQEGVPGLAFFSNQGDAGETLASTYFNAAKSNGAGNITAFTDREVIYRFDNNGSSILNIIGKNNVGIGTTTPWGKLSITQTGTAGDPAFVVEDSSSPDNSPFIITQTGDVGIGTTSPYAKLSVVGASGVVAEKFHATSTNATSTFSGGVTAKTLGVGTTSPRTTFSVTGNAYVTGGLGVGTVNTTASTVNLATGGSYRIGGTSVLNATTLGSGVTASSLTAVSTITTGTWSSTISTNSLITTQLGTLRFVNDVTSYGALTAPSIYSSASTGSVYPFLTAGHLILQGRAADTTDIVLSTGATAVERLVVKGGGNVGVASTSPWRKFGVTGTVGFSSSLSAESGNDNYLCIDPTTYEVTDGGAACGASSERYKENIQALDYGLEDILKLEAVSYDFKDTKKKGLGFIAEKVVNFIPDVVEVRDGVPESINYESFVPIFAKAFQELNAKFESMKESFKTGITEFGEILTDKLSSKEIYTAKLCVGDTCITESELKALLAGIGSSAPASGSTSSSSPTVTEPVNTAPPTIMIQGDNPAVIDVGTSYMDLGAIVKDSLGHELSYRIYLDDVEVSTVSIDTTGEATYTIKYEATDADGNRAFATRTVKVISPASEI